MMLSTAWNVATLLKCPALVRTVAISLLAFVTSPAQAQITPDVTLGGEMSTVTEGATVRGDLADLIEGGATRGGNLFHSFLEFNVSEGQRVYFASPVGIESILNRVTGDVPSNIFGILGVDGSADLFLLNPNGLVFGENAALDIEGSFYGSTGGAISLGDGVFSAVAPEQSRLLVVNPSVQLENYLTAASGNIENRGQLAAMGDLMLVANVLDLQGQIAAGDDLTLLALDEVQIRDASKTPFIGFAGDDLLVQGNEQVDIVVLSHPDSGLYSYGDMVLRSANPVGGDAHYWSGGSFKVETLDGEIGDLSSPIDPVIRALGDVSFNGYQGNSLHIIAAGSITIGSIFITGAEAGTEAVNFLKEDIELSNGLQVEVDGSLRPTLDLRAGVLPDAVTPVGSTGILDSAFINPISGLIEPPPDTNTTATSANITIGEIAFIQPQGLVLISNQYQPNLSLEGGDIEITGEGPLFDGIDVRGFSGDGGTVHIDSRGSINFSSTFIDTSSSLGNSGDVYLIAGDTIALTDGAVINANGQRGGAVSLEAETTSLINNSAINSNTLGEQDGGDVSVNGERLNLQNSSLIQLTTAASGNGGHILLDVRELNLEELSQLLTGVFSLTGRFGNQFDSLAQGSAGDIVVSNAESVSLSNNAAIGTLSFGQGNLEVGSAGNIFIDTDNLDVQNQSGIIASTLVGQGDAGNIEIKADGPVNFSDRSGLSTSSAGAGVGGDITIDSESLSFQNGARATTVTFNPTTFTRESFDSTLLQSEFIDLVLGIIIDASDLDVFGQADSGKISIDSDSIVLSGISSVNGARSGLFTETLSSGNAGEISINTELLQILDGAGISSSTSGEGNGSTITVDAGTVEIVGAASNESFRSSLFSESIGVEMSGDAGDLFLNVQNLSVTNGGLLSTSAFGSGAAGDIQVTAGSLSIEDGGSITTTTLGEGNGGNLDITVNGSAEVTGSASLTTGPTRSLIATGTTGAGRAGDLSLKVGKMLTVSDGAIIIASTVSSGAAGNLQVTADSIEIVGVSANRAFLSGIGSTSETIMGAITTGAAGDVTISSRLLSVRDGGRLSTETISQGAGGTLSVNVTESTELIGSGTILIRSSETGNSVPITNSSNLTTQTFGSADAGKLRLETEALSIRDGALISASTFGDGNAGDVEIVADSVEIIGQREDQLGFSSIQSISGQFPGQLPATGAAGNVAVTAQQLALEYRGNISTVTLGEASPGSIELNIENRLEMRDGDISTTAFQAAGGDIQINTAAGFESGTILLQGDSDITTSSQRDGGNITILGGGIVAFDDSDILTTSEDGTGGDITLGNFFTEIDPFNQPRPFDNNDRVDVNATGNIASGNISVPDVSFVQNSLNELSGEFVDTAALTASSCIARSDDTESTFVVTGGEGLPQQPESITSTYSTGTVQPVTEPAVTSTIQEPQRVYRLADGRLVLSHECEPSGSKAPA